MSFEVVPFEEWGGHELVPYVDGVSLLDLVSAYEQKSRFDVPGAYAGLKVESFKAGELADYLLGKPRYSFGDNPGAVALLGCDCGDTGCWPLLAQVLAEDGVVTWSDFAQPHRPKRDYTRFGPFNFNADHYTQTVRTLP
ncbi:hypothetical protein [Kribbella deserti]|uniref:SMI1/KNR4 family protein n=1 Tax=Kribbella deserti TaxID=1926257 RepID=A0ABV6QR33_9ACTN